MTSHLRRARSSAFVLFALGVLSLVAVGCAAGDRTPTATDTDIPLPPGVAAEIGRDADRVFYRFTSTLEPDAALAAYAMTLERAGYEPAGTQRGWARFTDGRRTIEARAEHGPPTQVLVHATSVADDLQPVTDPSAPPVSPASNASGPIPTSSTTPSAPPASPAPATSGGSGIGAGRQPDPPHGSTSGIGKGTSNAGGKGKGKATSNAGGKGKGKATSNAGGKGKGKGGERPTPTPRPTKSPKP